MIRRQTVVEKFSTLLDAKSEDSKGNLITSWKLIPSLENNMRLQMESYVDAGTQFWAKYWLFEARKANPDPLAVQHLWAYLQEACYWAAKETCDQIHTFDMRRLDYLQIARVAAIDPVAIFKKYDDSKGTTLETYGQFQLSRAILEVVRKGKEAASYSDWGLLRALSKKALKVALQKAGINEPQLSHCLLAWQCFNEIYTPTKVKRQLQPPNSQELAAFAELYNQSRFPQYQEPALSSSGLDTLLKTCIWAARASTTTPQLLALKDPENLDVELPTPDTSQEQAEQEEQWQQVRAVLAAALTALPESGQTMLQLWHGLGLKQKDIGEAISLRQYQVSRKLQEYKRPVLQSLVEWSRTQTGMSLSVEKIDELERRLNQWLDWYCKTSFFYKFLQTVLLRELRDEIPLLQRHYGQNLPMVKVARELNISETAVNQRLAQVKQCLQERLQNWVEDTHKLPPDALNSAAKPIAALVEKWLTNATYGSFEIERRLSHDF